MLHDMWLFVVPNSQRLLVSVVFKRTSAQGILGCVYGRSVWEGVWGVFCCC